MPPAAVLDACTLYPVGLRDTLLSVAQAHVFRPLWSADILAEVRAAVLRSVPGVDEVRLDRMFADMIVTWNIRHFPPSACRRPGVVVESPDEFLAKLHGNDPDAVEVALIKQVSRYAAPPMTVEELLARHAQRLPAFVSAVRAWRRGGS